MYGHMLPKRGQLFMTAARLPKLSLRSVTDASIVHLSIDSVIDTRSGGWGGENETIGGIVEKEEGMSPEGRLSVAIKAKDRCSSFRDFTLRI